MACEGSSRAGGGIVQRGGSVVPGAGLRCAVVSLGSSPRALRRLSWSPRLGGFSMELRMEPSRSAILGITERGRCVLKGRAKRL